MQAFFMGMLSALWAVLGRWAGKVFLNQDFWGWAILWCAKKYVTSTATTADDEWYEKLKEMIDGAKG